MTNQNIPKIIYENEYLLIVDKPIKMLSHPDQHETQLPDLLTYFKHHDYRIITRLDVNTSGLVLIAKTQEASSVLNEMSIKKQITKIYSAVAVGYFPKDEDTIEAFLLKDSLQGIVRLSEKATPDAQKITTRYRVLKEENQLSYVEIELITGKTHQIRAHLALIGHPVLGDPLYGNKRVNDHWHQKTQCLASSKIRFENIEKDHPFHFMNDKEFQLKSFPYQSFLDKK